MSHIVPIIFSVFMGLMLLATLWIGTVEIVYGTCNAKDDQDFDEGGPWLIVDICRWVFKRR